MLAIMSVNSWVPRAQKVIFAGALLAAVEPPADCPPGAPHAASASAPMPPPAAANVPRRVAPARLPSLVMVLALLALLALSVLSLMRLLSFSAAARRWRAGCLVRGGCGWCAARPRRRAAAARPEAGRVRRRSGRDRGAAGPAPAP